LFKSVVVTLSYLRRNQGDRYAAVHVVFGQGRIDRTEIPPPRIDSIEVHLAAAGGQRIVNLRGHRPPRAPL